MAFDFDHLPMREAAQLDCRAEACRSVAEHSQWRIVRWWYHRKAAKLAEGADIWRGLEWRTEQAIERQMNHEKNCTGRKQDEQEKV